MNTVLNKIIHPIIIPTPLFLDRFGNQNQYKSMNPSLWIDQDTGEYVLLIRNVNYARYPNKKFTLFEYSSESHYCIMRGEINQGFESSVSPLEIIWNLPRYNSWWKGVEDVRFIDRNNILCCIPECNHNSPGIFRASLIDNQIMNIKKCEPSQKEKNWMPFSSEKVVYSVNPFVIKQINEDIKETIPLTTEQDSDLCGWHGSTNGIIIGEYLVFLIHHNTDKQVLNRWLLVHQQNKCIKYSVPFVFFGHSFIEFACSLCQYRNKIYISLGVNDSSAFIVEIEAESILTMC